MAAEGLEPLPQRLVRAFQTRQLDAGSDRVVIEITVRQEGRPEHAVVRLTARQAWWLCGRLGATHPVMGEE